MAQEPSVEGTTDDKVAEAVEKPPSAFLPPSSAIAQASGFAQAGASGKFPSAFGSPDGSNLAAYLANLTPAEASAKSRDDAIVNGFFYIFLTILAMIAVVIFLYCIVSTILYCLKQDNHRPAPRSRRCSCACSDALNTYRAERSRICSYPIRTRAEFSSVYTPGYNRNDILSQF